MIERLFLEHPRSVGENYVEHLHTASGFGATMIVAGLACMVHAVVPALFARTGSAAIERLHNKMILNRRRISIGPSIHPKAE